ncbi:MAG: alkaline phosphatase [Thiocapsa sp.]|uniref:alkaline phosphatase n=1 Tax=Thiocapsa sp. TaxID=2024551 RepID=UPI001BCE3203|nr:alkaline phosphatase [Thiocapsa sp.]QVL46865.1 MAG: alkaline phosphatase [Thiocapsa sp.]
MYTRHQHRLSGLLSLSLVAGLQFAGSASAAEVKNIIILIPDGQSQSIQTLGRWYRGEPLALDEMGAGTMAAWMVNSITTDSAPAGTAMATGYKTTDKFIGVGPIEANALSTYRLPAEVPGASDAEKWNWFSYRPLATVLEGAKRQGKATGLISTSRVTHATPAGYAAHVDSRSLENDIAEQLVYQNLDVVFGGGWDRLLPTPDGSRTDGENLREVLTARGYQWVQTKAEMTALKGGKAWGLFAKSAMMPDIDRQYSCEQADEQACNEPTLAEMTGKAIELLSKNENGFILTVEGSQIDWAGHANDPAYMLHDFLAFDDAVRVALEFAKTNPGTMLLAAPDHNTGGLTLGNRSVNWTYTDITVEDLLDPVKGMQTTAQLIAGTLPEGRDPTPAELQAAVLQYWGITLSEEDAQEIIAYEKDPDVNGYGYSIPKIVSERHTVLGWTSHGHSGEDLPFWSFGTNAPVGHIDNTDFAWFAAEAFGLNLDLSDPNGLNQKLFVDLKSAVKRPMSTDLTNPNNPVLTIGQHERFHLHANKDYVLLKRPNGTTLTCLLDGVVVYAPKADDGNGRWFAPAKAIEVIRNPLAHCSR